jgi:hypothetical protein
MVLVECQRNENNIDKAVYNEKMRQSIEKLIFPNHFKQKICELTQLWQPLFAKPLQHLLAYR